MPALDTEGPKQHLASLRRAEKDFCLEHWTATASQNTEY